MWLGPDISIMPTLYVAEPACCFSSSPLEPPWDGDLHANWIHGLSRFTRTSVADCFGSLLFRLKYENTESKRQIMEPQAKVQTGWFFFLSPSPWRSALQKLKTPPTSQSPWPYNNKIMKWHWLPAASCLYTIQFGLERDLQPQLRSSQTQDNNKGEDPPWLAEADMGKRRDPQRFHVHMEAEGATKQMFFPTLGKLKEWEVWNTKGKCQRNM